NTKAQFSHWHSSLVFTLEPKPSFHWHPNSPVFTLAPKPSFHTHTKAQFPHWSTKPIFLQRGSIHEIHTPLQRNQRCYTLHEVHTALQQNPQGCYTLYQVLYKVIFFLLFRPERN
ncbi:hypothetical protein V8G54_027160, partial [Vigna mungo]